MNYENYEIVKILGYGRSSIIYKIIINNIML